MPRWSGGDLPSLWLCAAVVALLALREFFNLGELVGLRAYRYWTFACSAGIFYAQYVAGSVDALTLGSGVTIVRPSSNPFAISLDEMLLIFVFGSGDRWARHTPSVARCAHCVIDQPGRFLMIALPLSYIVRINEIGPAGRDLVLFTLSLIWAGESWPTSPAAPSDASRSRQY